MTTQEKQNFIREKCIEAHGGYDDFGTPSTYRGYELADKRELRLADIFLAVKASSKCDTYWEYEVISDLIWKKYNLSHDSLEEQSEETIDFIYNLLSA